jgi:hypothetical protein
MTRGGKEQHSKIGPVNDGEDVAEAWLYVGRGDKSGTNARCGGAAGGGSGKLNMCICRSGLPPS